MNFIFIKKIFFQKSTFETLQNDTQNYEFKEEVVKRSKQQQSPVKQFVSPHLKSSQSHNSSQKEKSLLIHPRSNSQNVIDQNVEEVINNEDLIEINKWLDPDFQKFVKKNFSKQQKKLLIQQLKKQIQSDSDEDVDESQIDRKQEINKKQKKDRKKKSSKQSPPSSLNSTDSNDQEHAKKQLNLYERYQQRQQNYKKSPQKESENENNLQELAHQANKFSQIKEIKNEEEQIEYIQFSQRCKAELERQQNMKKKKMQNKGNNLLEVDFDNQNAESSQKLSFNQFKSIESIESENVVMTKESKLLLQEIYNEVQNALKKYDYIIQENQKNRKNLEQNKKDTNPDNASNASDNLNIVTTNSLKTNNSQKRFDTNNQLQDEQSQNFRKSQGQFIPRQNQSLPGKQTPSKRQKQQIQTNGKQLPSLNFQSDSPLTSSIVSPAYNRDLSINMPINKSQKNHSGNVSNFDGNQIIRLSKMEENDAENAFNNRRQQIFKALKDTTKQRKNSTQIQQRPMNHSQSRASHNVSHIRTPSNSMSQRNSLIFQNQGNDYDLNSSITSGNKYKAGNLLNKFLSPKNGSNRHPSSKDLETPTQSLKSSLFAGRAADNQKVQQHFEKKSYQLTDQPSKQDFDKNLQVLEPETKIKLKQKTQNENTTNNTNSETIHLENVKRSKKIHDDNQQNGRKKKKELYEIYLGNKDDKKKQIRERKERVQSIYDQAQKSLSDLGEQQISQKKHQKIQQQSRDNFEDKDEEILPTSNTYRQSSQHLIQNERGSTEEELPQYQENQDRFIKRSVSAHFNIFQQKKLAILHDIEDLNKLIEQENEAEIYKQQQNQENEDVNQIQHEQIIHPQFKKNQKPYSQVESRKNSKHQSQQRTRNNSTMQEFQRPILQGFVQTHSYTELAVDQKKQNSDQNIDESPTKSSTPAIPLLKLREQEGSDKKNNNSGKKERFLQQIQQSSQQQALNREPKRVNSQHVFHNKDTNLMHERLGQTGVKKREIAQKENNQHSATKNTRPQKIRQMSTNNQEDVDQDQDNENDQINLYRSLSPNRDLSNGRGTTNFIERNKKWQAVKKNRMEEIQNNQNNKEMKECTFKPQTNKQIIKYNPYLHKEQLKQQKNNFAASANKTQKDNLSPRIAVLQKNTQNQQTNIENIPIRTKSISQPRRKKESDDLGIGKIQGLQSPIMQRFSEVEFWSQSDASVFKAINDIDMQQLKFNFNSIQTTIMINNRSYQAELKKEINDVLDIIQGFQIGVTDKQTTKKSLSQKKLPSQKDINNKQPISQKTRKQ